MWSNFGHVRSPTPAAAPRSMPADSADPSPRRRANGVDPCASPRTESAGSRGRRSLCARPALAPAPAPGANRSTAVSRWPPPVRRGPGRRAASSRAPSDRRCRAGVWRSSGVGFRELARPNEWPSHGTMLAPASRLPRRNWIATCAASWRATISSTVERRPIFSEIGPATATIISRAAHSTPESWITAPGAITGAGIVGAITTAPPRRSCGAAWPRRPGTR